MAGEASTTITVMSNDGSNTLATVDYSSYRYSITVTATGFSAEHDGTFSDYVYVGTGTFLGISNSPNTITPDYAIGDVFYPSSDFPTFYIVEETKEETVTVNFDLSTLNLLAGTHEITVKARASGYLDSPASNAVSYVVAEETTYKLSGMWLFEHHLVHTSNSTGLKQEIAFTSKGKHFSAIQIGTKNSIEMWYEGYQTGGAIYSIREWGVSGWDGGYDIEDDGYFRITFDSPQTVSKEFYEWFTANAEQVPVTLTVSAYFVDNEAGGSVYYSKDKIPADPSDCYSDGYTYLIDGGYSETSPEIESITGISSFVCFAVDALINDVIVSNCTVTWYDDYFVISNIQDGAVVKIELFW